MTKRKLTGYLKHLDIFGKPVSLTLKGERTFKTLIGATCTLCVYLVVLFYLAHGALYNAQRQGEIHLFHKSMVNGDPDSSYKQNFTMYAGPIGSEVPDYEVFEGTRQKSLIFNVAFGLSDRNDQP